MRRPTRSAPIAAATASTTATGKRMRPSGPPPLVVAAVGAGGQELVQQVAVGAVQLHAVEPGLDRVAGGLGEVLDGLLDALVVQGLRGDQVRGAVGGEDRAVGTDRGRADRGRGELVEARVADPAGVHELGEDEAAAGVDRVGDRLPAGDLLGRVQAGRVEVALPDRRRLGTLRDDQAGTGALRVVGRHQLGRAATRPVRPAARHRRHHHPVACGVPADTDRFERCAHRRLPLG